MTCKRDKEDKNMQNPHSMACVIIASAIIATLSGCSSNVYSTKLTHQNNSTGIIYTLPEKDISINAEWEIVYCSDKSIISISTANENELMTSGEQYRLDLDKFQRPNKANSITITKRGNFISSISTKSTDKTYEIITNTASGVLGIAKAALLPSGPTILSADQQLCEDTTLELIKKQNEIESTITSKTQDLKGLYSAAQQNAETKKSIESITNEIEKFKNTIAATKKSLTIYATKKLAPTTHLDQ